MTAGGGALGVLRQDGERRLQAVCEIAGLGDRAVGHLLALAQQRIEVVHQRLHLGRIASLDLCTRAALEIAELRPQLVEGGDAASDQHEAEDQRDDGEHGHRVQVDMHDDHRVAHAAAETDEHGDNQHQPQRP